MEDDLLKEFLIETYENLDKLDGDLVKLEKNPDSRPILDNIFRVFHSCKGACGFLGFSKLESVAHSGENLLSSMRDGVIRLDSNITGVLLSTVDIIRKIISVIENTRGEGDIDCSPIIGKISAIQSGAGVSPPAPPIARKSAEKPNESIPAPPVDIDGELARMTPEQKERFEKLIGDVLDRNGAIVSTDISEAIVSTLKAFPAQAPAMPDNAPADVASEASTDNSAKDNAVQATHDAEGQQQDTRSSTAADTTIRVNIEVLDNLMNLVGELVLIRNQFLQQVNTSEDSIYTSISQRLNHITTELQEGIMKTRMQPINNVWRTFPRVVRDLSNQLGKKVRLEMDGKETELDKTIIEAIKDPLTHLVRNSIDHGIEDAQMRTAAKKPEEGCINLHAYHESGQVIIEITDDGAGINIERIRRKALEKSIVTQKQIDGMSEREIFNMIFMPGFSTAEKITNISGRGVGMDVVRKNVEAIGGSIDISSVFGKSTTVRIKIPLTLAIIPAIIITCGKERYAIPQVNLLEVVHIDGESVAKSIEDIHGTPVYRLRGKLLPIVYLNDELRIARKDCAAGESMNIIVLQAGEKNYGLIVDAVNDTEEIVVKPLGKHLKSIPVYAGATIRGDGKIALILDVLGIAKSSGVVSESRNKLLAQKTHQETKVSDDGLRKILLFRTSDDGRMGIELSKVSRLEDFSIRDIERAGDASVVQYRGNIMPLLNISTALEERRKKVRSGQSDDREKISVVVYSSEGRTVGLVVDAILDIVEEAFDLQKAGCRDGVLGTAVIQKRITEIVDVESVIEKRGLGSFGGGEM